jgi:hypothetical protein
VGRGLLKGDRLAWVVGVVVMAFRVAYALVTGLDGVGFTGPISLIVNAAILAALYSGREAFARTGR